MFPLTKTIGLLLAAFLATQEPSYQGKPLSYWLSVIRDRDEEMLSLAFDAIRSLGPDARAAVPELTSIVKTPFVPVRLGKDSDEVIASKLYDIEVRSDAIDALASVGEAASPATVPLIQWALTIRIIPEEMRTREDDERFIDLVTLDVEYRIAIINAIERFGQPAIPILAQLLTAPDAAQRKFVTAILGADVLPIVADLLKSQNCEDEELAIRILNDLEPVVAKAYFTELKRMLVCDADYAITRFCPIDKPSGP